MKKSKQQLSQVDFGEGMLKIDMENIYSKKQVKEWKMYKIRQKNYIETQIIYLSSLSIKEINVEDLIPFKNMLQPYLTTFSGLNDRKKFNEQYKKSCRPKSESVAFYYIWYLRYEKNKRCLHFQKQIREFNFLQYLQILKESKTLNDSHSNNQINQKKLKNSFYIIKILFLIFDEVAQLVGPCLFKIIKDIYEFYESFETASMILKDFFLDFSISEYYEIFLDYQSIIHLEFSQN